MELDDKKFEENNLRSVQKSIAHTLSDLQEKRAELAEELENRKTTLSQNHYELDKSGDLNSYLNSMSELDERITTIEKEISNLKKQYDSPYFARIDFLKTGTKQPLVTYVGLSSVYSDKKMLVSDWRAPISSLFYDYELGKASFVLEEDGRKKRVNGELLLKRQIKVEDGLLKSYFDTNLTIEDGVLQDILSKNVSTKMKQIVSTIQKEQNKLVRTEEFDHLLIQGVAGSGKTSIALHRAAYLLYRHRNSLTSRDIIIISPNNIFSSYIGEVLPQLGEDNLAETTYEQICQMELKSRILSREELLDKLASHPTQALLNEVSYKSSFEYLDELIKFIYGDFAETFSPKTLTYVTKKGEKGEALDEISFPEEQTRKLFFEDYKSYTINERLSKIAWQYAAVFAQKRHYSKAQTAGLKARFKSILYTFLPITEYEKILQIFLARLGLKENDTGKISYLDKGPLMIIKHFLHGFEHDLRAKYLIIDEMQDFCPTDLYVFKKIWSCRSILLGDVNQCIEKCLTKEYLQRVQKLWGSQLFTLNKTYRSTHEIAEFCSKIIGLEGIEYVNRKGKKPLIKQTSDIAQDVKNIVKNEFAGFEHIAIICKCQKELKALAKELEGKVNFKVIREPEDYNAKLVLVTCAAAKGIEFDGVIIPNADADYYKNALDKNFLYVAATRALHGLAILYNTVPTPFLPDCV